MSQGSYDGFMIQLTSQGDLSWAHSFGNSTQERLDSSVIDQNNTIYNVGYFRETIDFDPTNGVDLISANADIGGSVFIQRITSDGSYGGTSVLHSIYSNPTYLSSARAFDVEVTLDGNIIVFGIYQKLVDFDPSLTEEYLLETQGGEDDAFVLNEKSVITNYRTAIRKKSQS